MVKAAAKREAGTKNLRQGAAAGRNAHQPRLETFVLEYLKDFNGTRAAKAAGYSPRSAHTEAVRLLKDPRVRALLAAAKERRQETYEITTERVLHELACLGLSNAMDFVCVTGKNAGQVDLSKVTRDQAAAISELTVRTTTDGKGKNAVSVTKLKLASKVEPLNLLGKHLGIFKEEPGAKLQVTFVIDGLEEKTP